MWRSKLALLCALLFYIFSFNGIAYAELILSAPPRESPAAGQKMYGSLAEQLSRLLGTRVSYHHPGNWLRYQVDMRHNRFDIVFDGPHFASWRIKYHQHAPLVKLPGTLKFYLITLQELTQINEPKDLAAHRVCVIPPPNLSALVLLARLDGPAREPIIQPIKGGVKKVYQGLLERDCDAAVVRSTFYDEKLSEQQRAQLKILFASPEMPNQVITVSDALTAQQRAAMKEWLLAGEGRTVAEPVVRRFTGNQQQHFVDILGNEYTGYSSLLEDVVLGWRRSR